MKQIIHKKQINRTTEAKFSQVDVAITQDGDLVVLDKTELLELAQILQNEIYANDFYSRKKQKEIGEMIKNGEIS